MGLGSKTLRIVAVQNHRKGARQLLQQPIERLGKKQIQARAIGSRPRLAQMYPRLGYPPEPE